MRLRILGLLKIGQIDIYVKAILTLLDIALANNTAILSFSYKHDLTSPNNILKEKAYQFHTEWKARFENLTGVRSNIPQHKFMLPKNHSFMSICGTIFGSRKKVIFSKNYYDFEET